MHREMRALAPHHIAHAIQPGKWAGRRKGPAYRAPRLVAHPFAPSEARGLRAAGDRLAIAGRYQAGARCAFAALKTEGGAAE